MGKTYCGMSRVARLTDYRRQNRVFFSRHELDQLLQIYSRQVARGEWRDYAIDQSDGIAAFSIFRHSLETPLYTVVKTAPGLSRSGEFSLMHRRFRLAAAWTLGEVLAQLQREMKRGGRLAGIASPLQA